MKTPIGLIIDDPAPIISVYHEHARSPKTADGRALIPTFPNSMLLDFCDVIETYGICGKFSVVPMPGNKGSIVDGLDGVPQNDVDEWLNIVKNRVMKQFSIGPEMLTHYLAVDIPTGDVLPIRENEWANTQDRTTLTPYISRALELLRAVGIRAHGVSSPWNFGVAVEEEYTHSVMEAVHAVNGYDTAWLFMHCLVNRDGIKPWVEYKDAGTLVCFPATTEDHFWQTINSPRTDDAYISAVADELITADGADGAIIRVLKSGGYPILLTHWQSLMSNGLGTGLRALAEVGKRVEEHLSDRVEWQSFEQLMTRILEHPAAYPKPTI